MKHLKMRKITQRMKSCIMRTKKEMKQWHLLCKIMIFIGLLIHIGHYVKFLRKLQLNFQLDFNLIKNGPSYLRPIN